MEDEVRITLGSKIIHSFLGGELFPSMKVVVFRLDLFIVFAKVPSYSMTSPVDRMGIGKNHCCFMDERVALFDAGVKLTFLANTYICGFPFVALVGQKRSLLTICYDYAYISSKTTRIGNLLSQE